MNVFDIIGPVMIGPSSSHTAGAARIGGGGRGRAGAPRAGGGRGPLLDRYNALAGRIARKGLKRR